MPNIVASKGGSCDWITSPCLGGLKVKSLLTAFSDRSHDFLPCHCGDWEVAGGHVSGSWLHVKFPSGLFKVWVRDEGCTTCLSSILQISKPNSRQFPGAPCCPGSHFVGTALLAWNFGSFKNSSFFFAVDSWLLSDIILLQPNSYAQSDVLQDLS